MGELNYTLEAGSTVNGIEIENDIMLVVEYDYEEPCMGDRETPPSGGGFDICKVLHDGEDISDQLTEGDLKRIERALEAELEGYEEDEAERKADAKADRMQADYEDRFCN